MLFGHPHAGTSHDLPGALDYFVQATGGVLGDIASILQNHTIAPILVAFQPLSSVDQLLRQLRSSGLGQLKFQLGLVTSQFRAHFPLKACPQCMRDDVAHHYVAYWHRCHQLPGVWICPIHGDPLLEAQHKANGVGRFEWVLPAEAELDAPRNTIGQPIPVQENDALVRVARGALALGNRSLYQVLSPASVVHCHARALVAAGYATKTGRPRINLAIPSYLAHCAQLRVVPELAPLPATSLAAEQHLRHMLSVPRFVRHPLHQLAIISWLYPTPEIFLSECDAWTEPTIDCQAQTPSPEQRKTEISPALLNRFANAEISAREAAASAGVDIKTFLVCAAGHGLAYKRRPKKLKAERYVQLILDLETGEDKAIVAAKHGISVSTITTILRTTPGLQARWHAVRDEAAKAKARQSWLAVSEANPGINAKTLRLLEPAAFAWLYRNDRAWLQEHSVSKPREYSSPRIAWDERDAELAQLVKQAALDITNTSPDLTRISLQMLYKQLPLLRMRLGALARLPLTVQAIQQVTKARRQQGSGLLPNG